MNVFVVISPILTMHNWPNNFSLNAFIRNISWRSGLPKTIVQPRFALNLSKEEAWLGVSEEAGLVPSLNRWLVGFSRGSWPLSIPLRTIETCSWRSELWRPHLPSSVLASWWTNCATSTPSCPMRTATWYTPSTPVSSEMSSVYPGSVTVLFFPFFFIKTLSTQY